MLTHMKLAGVKTGLLMNFNVTKLKSGIKRFILLRALRVLRGETGLYPGCFPNLFSARNRSFHRRERGARRERMGTLMLHLSDLCALCGKMLETRG